MIHMGLPVIESPHLPIEPSPGDVARRIVREGMRDVLEQLGEEVGNVGLPTHILSTKQGLIVSPQVMESLRRHAVEEAPLFYEGRIR